MVLWKFMPVIYLQEKYMLAVHCKAWVQSGLCYSIVHLEAANVLITLRCWVKSLQNELFIMWCDNYAIVNCFFFS